MATRIYSAGQLDKRVQFQQRGAMTNGLGEKVDGWVDLLTTVWAKVEPLSGRDFLAAGAMQQSVDTRFVVRYRAAFEDASLRLVWRGTPYAIVSAIPVDGGTEWLEIMATSGVRDARV